MMDLKQEIASEKERVNSLVRSKLDSSRLERLAPESAELIKNWDRFKGQLIGGCLRVYDQGNPSFADENFILTSLIDTFEIVEVIPQLDEEGQIKHFEYYGFWSPFWFVDSGWQVNHAACFTEIKSFPGGLLFIGCGDYRGEYDLLLSTIEVEINQGQAEIVSEWLSFKKENQDRVNLARNQIREEFVESIIRKTWLGK